MAPNTRNSRSPTPATSRKRSRETSPTPTTTTKKQRLASPKPTAKPPKLKARRADQARSAPISSRTRGSRSASASPRKKSKEFGFDLQAIKPSTTAFCPACNAQIPKTPEVNAPAREFYDSQLMPSILQARGRAANIASAYANAKQEHTILSNQDESMDYKMGIAPTPELAPPDGTHGRRDKDIIPFEWYHCPYTAELAKGVGKLVGELGRA
jgi:hypothetical protein